MATKFGRAMGAEETVFTASALHAAAKGHKLPPEAKRALGDVTRTAAELEAAVAEAATAAPAARPDSRDEERDVDMKARALDLFLEAHATLGDAEALAAREALFPDGRGFARERGAVKQGELRGVLARAAERAAALTKLGAKPFVTALERSLDAYVATLTAAAAQPTPKPVRVIERLAAAQEAMRRYLEVVNALATLSGDGLDEALLAPFAHRAAAAGKRASSADAAGEASEREPVAAPSAQA